MFIPTCDDADAHGPEDLEGRDLAEAAAGAAATTLKAEFSTSKSPPPLPLPPLLLLLPPFAVTAFDEEGLGSLNACVPTVPLLISAAAAAVTAVTAAAVPPTRLGCGPPPRSWATQSPRRSITIALVLSRDPFRSAVAVSSSEHPCNHRKKRKKQKNKKTKILEMRKGNQLLPASPEKESISHIREWRVDLGRLYCVFGASWKECFARFGLNVRSQRWAQKACRLPS